MAIVLAVVFTLAVGIASRLYYSWRRRAARKRNSTFIQNSAPSYPLHSHLVVQLIRPVNSVLYRRSPPPGLRRPPRLPPPSNPAPRVGRALDGSLLHGRDVRQPDKRIGTQPRPRRACAVSRRETARHLLPRARAATRGPFLRALVLLAHIHIHVRASALPAAARDAAHPAAQLRAGARHVPAGVDEPPAEPSIPLASSGDTGVRQRGATTGGSRTTSVLH